MTIITFLINVSGATLLLLFAVRMVQTGIERSMGPSFRRIVTRYRDNRVQTALAGILLAIILQSATAAGLLAAGFSASGVMSFTGGLGIVLGADLGSAMVVQILSFRPEWLIPVLLALGGYLFLKVEGRTPKQIGRILLGIAFILLALRFISEAVQPIRDSAFMPAIAGYLESDFVTAFLVGAVATFIMYSSVAAILMTVTFVVTGVLPVAAGISVVMGANLGAAMLLIWLSRGMSNATRRIPLANASLRGVGSIVGLLVVNLTPLVGVLDGLGGGQTLVTVHLLFNATLLIISLPFITALERPMTLLLPDRAPAKNGESLKPLCALDQSVLHRPGLAIASLTREVLRMSQIVEVMARPVMQFYDTDEPDAIKAVQAMERDINQALSGVRRYVAAVSRDRITKDQSRRVRELAEYAINLATAAEIIGRRLLELAQEKHRKQLRFSEAGWEELQLLHERVMANMALAFNVLVSEDIESARLLMEEKSEMAAKERKSRKKHLKRLREGAEASFESSDVHLETLRNLKELNSNIAAIAYPILYRGGQLLETRLIETIEHEPE
ncbi:MAG: Na/Pi cotransporter family protein [Alphaproteobacteria bacterium]|nr:Na/Pi cotransporter family protein [Alphaproteobacteria bacterium]